MKISLENCNIRNYHKRDVDELVKQANNVKIWRNVRDLFPHPYTKEDAKWWVNKVKKESPKVNYVIEVNGKFAGSIGFLQNDDVYRTTLEIGYWLGEEYWGKGVMTEAVKAMIIYGFEEFEVMRIEARVFSWNVGSMRVLEKVGFVKEAVLKNRLVKQGKIGDEHIYAVFKA